MNKARWRIAALAWFTFQQLWKEKFFLVPLGLGLLVIVILGFLGQLSYVEPGRVAAAFLLLGSELF